MMTCKGSVSCLNMKADLGVSTAVHCGKFYNCWSTEWASALLFVPPRMELVVFKTVVSLWGYS